MKAATPIQGAVIGLSLYRGLFFYTTRNGIPHSKRSSILHFISNMGINVLSLFDLPSDIKTEDEDIQLALMRAKIYTVSITACRL